MGRIVREMRHSYRATYTEDMMSCATNCSVRNSHGSREQFTMRRISALFVLMRRRTMQIPADRTATLWSIGRLSQNIYFFEPRSPPARPLRVSSMTAISYHESVRKKCYELRQSETPPRKEGVSLTLSRSDRRPRALREHRYVRTERLLPLRVDAPIDTRIRCPPIKA